MFSGQLLKASLHEALTTAGGGGPVLYFPLSAEQAEFDITDTEPGSAADFTGNRARMLIDGPIGGSYPIESTYATMVIQFSAYGVSKPDCGFLAETVANWVGRLKRSDLPMQGQCLERANVTRFTGPVYVGKSDLNVASFDVMFHLQVI